MKLKITDKAGVTLKTAGKYCSEDIDVTIDESLLSCGIPIEVATAAEMDALLVDENVGKIYKYVGTTNVTYEYGELYQVVEEE